MAQINADPVVLERVARELDKIADDLDDQGRSLASAGNDTAAVWKSRYTGRFLESVKNTMKKVAAASGKARALADALRGIAADVRRAEEEIRRLNASG